MTKELWIDFNQSHYSRPHTNSLYKFEQNVGTVADGNTDANSVENQWNNVRKIADWSNDQIIQIAKRVIAESDDDKKLKEYSETFLSFLTEKKVDGEMFMKYKDENQFGDDIVAFSNNNRKLRNPSRYLFRALKQFNVSTPLKESMELKKVSFIISVRFHRIYAFLRKTNM